MASNLIPMLSSSPPPLDENGSFDDDDDEFGNFTCAGAVKVLDSPLSSPVKSVAPPLTPVNERNGAGSKKVTWNDAQHSDPAEEDDEEPCEKTRCNSALSTDDPSYPTKDDCTYGEKIVVFSDDVEEFNCNEDEMGFSEDKQGLSAKYAFTHSEQHDNTSQESVTDSGLCSSSQRSETSPLPPGEVLFAELSPETEAEENQEVFLEDPTSGYLKTEPSCNGEAPSIQGSAENCDETTTPVNESQQFGDTLDVSKTVTDEDDFQDFEASPVNISSLSFDDGDGEVGACVQSTESVVVQPHSRTELSESEDNDDFADFACAQFDSSSAQHADVFSVAGPVGDGFADFSQATFSAPCAIEDSEWADFTSTQETPPFLATSVAGLSIASAHSCQQVVSSTTEQIQVLLGSAFPSVSEGDVSEERQLVAEVQPILGTDTSKSCLFWLHLQNLDESVSLQYHWAGSHSFQKTLHSLNIDSRNVDVIPPAHFDWSSSGLVNPLDPNQSSSTLLDLDFFTNLETASSPLSSSAGKQHSAKTSSLEEELLGMDPICASPSDHPVQMGGDLVQKLLSSVPASSLLHNSLGSRGQTSVQHSSRTAELLDLLPDLSFMQAKVLMFPIRGILDSS